jgi:hypothetical protein
MNQRVRRTGIAVLAAAAAGAALAWVIRDQMSRHSRDLFSPYFFRRLAALGHMAREDASVHNINLLNDFVAWEPRKSLQNRAYGVLQRMERELEGPALAG